MAAELKKLIENTISDMAADLLYYDRKEDEELPVGAIERAVEDGIITKEEIISMFAAHINKMEA